MKIIDFSTYIQGKIKLDKLCDYLVEDIKNNDKKEFLNKWKMLEQRFPQMENLNISKVFSALISQEKTDWFDKLPFNKTCYAVGFAARKYYLEPNEQNKAFLNYCVDNMVDFSRSIIFKEIEDLRKFSYVDLSFSEQNSEKCKSYFEAVIYLDELFRNLQPQNPDKFLTHMIISQGKHIELNQSSKSLVESEYFNEVTVKLMKRLIDFNSIGANKLNNKKDSQSLNEVYHFFQKYYMYNKVDKMLQKYPEREKSPRNKI